MTYAVSDLHGCYDKFINLLKKINFSDSDTLYILGDVVDRGNDGIKLLLYLNECKNIITLRGNHDYKAYCLLKGLASSYDKIKIKAFKRDAVVWLCDGGKPTYESFMKLNDKEKETVLKFLNSMSVYEETDIGGNSFFLSHTVPEKEKMLDFDSCKMHDFILGEPDYEEVYFPDKFIVTGHTPTSFIDKESKGKIWRKNNHFAIDCGAVFGNPLGCICLDTLEEFYLE